MATPAKAANTPAYATYKSFKGMINGFRENGMPDHLTKSVMPGSASGKPTMAASLKFLGLMDASEVPTEKLIQLIESEDNYSTVLESVVRKSYPFFKDGSIDLENTTTDKVVEKFEELGASGSTVSKCMAFFLAACKDSGIKVSQYVKAPAPAVNKGNKKRNGGRVESERSVAAAAILPVKEAGYTPFEIPIPGAKPVRLLLPDGLSKGQWTMFTAVLGTYLEEFQKLSSTTASELTEQSIDEEAADSK